MTKEELLGKICYADAINECCSEDGNTSCEKCELEMSILLDKYAEQIRAEVIDECIREIANLAIYYAGDKEGNAITPKMLIKNDVIKALEQLKEQK